ncbi:Bug family tripartite tricarboxylate transporter substrate binding protein [Roseomonas populi]|uniref:Tripartite tricarboxylate transporter substrate-binding protein n=1 Tax=Roseomonas populi TaxID=3121582 RepID=A0ABT1WX93_9PROT|nr:tripartite tricarboxylate transporter substrate-binding protein [Roseomonas pecuniae]MCR0980458.1 tripartite tricarboxylate transporter substrate-binding protein [Roseomonas pecuniae]
MLDRRSLLLSPLLAKSALAQESFPSRPVSFVVPLTAGGPADVIFRPLGNALQAELGQPVVMDYRPGAGGTVAMDYAIRSRPDGHTLAIASNSQYAIAPFLFPMPYDNDRAYLPVILVAQAPSFVVVHRSVPASTLAELIALAKGKPDGLSFATAGVGFTSHLATELLMERAGVSMLHVPYRGASAATQAVVSGEVQMNFMEAAFLAGQLPGGQIRALAVTSRERHPLFPDVPTVGEAGIPGFETATYWGLVAPAGVPTPVLERLRAACLRHVASAEERARLIQAGFLPVAGDAAAFERNKAEESAKWGPLIRSRNIRVT